MPHSKSGPNSKQVIIGEENELSLSASPPLMTKIASLGRRWLGAFSALASCKLLIGFLIQFLDTLEGGSAPLGDLLDLLIRQMRFFISHAGPPAFNSCSILVRPEMTRKCGWSDMRWTNRRAWTRLRATLRTLIMKKTWLFATLGLALFSAAAASVMTDPLAPLHAPPKPATAPVMPVKIGRAHV